MSSYNEKTYVGGEWANGELIERFSIAFTRNGKRHFALSRKIK